MRWLLAALAVAGALRAPPRLAPRRGGLRAAAGGAPVEHFDAVVIGSGIGGLSAAAVLSAFGRRVCVLEAHEHLGGCAHEFVVGGFRFETGPSLYAGLSPDRSPNPLKHVFQIIGEEPEWITYDRWGTALPEGTFAAAVGADDFATRILPTYGGPGAAAQFARLMRRVEPLGAAVFGVPAAAVREDAFAALTLGRYLPQLAALLVAGPAPALSRPFAEVLDAERVTDPFLRRWLDMICFLLQGATTDEAPTTLMAYMLSDFYRDGVVLDYPRGGARAIVDALVRGVEKGGGRVDANRAVARVLVERGVTAGVALDDGSEVRAPVVVSNADVWTTRGLVAAAPRRLAAYLDAQCARVTRCESFLHLHVGIDGAGLPTAPCEALPAQWAALDADDVAAPRNLALVSMPSLLDPGLAPPGKHCIHAYVPATEPFDAWATFDAKDGGYASPEYRAAKDAAVRVLWRAIERYIPDVRARAEVSLPATPLTHRRFTRRDRGAYGAYLPASRGEQLMGHATPLKGFYLCGDSTFPGIGVPAVAASGLITAASILSPAEHWRLLDRIRS